MKRKLLCLGVLLAILLGCLPLCVGAAPLPALAVLANDLSLSKCGLVGNDLSFFTEDFDLLTGAKTESITVLTLPASESGTLYLAGRAVEPFTQISRKDLTKLQFRSACDKENACSFTFRHESDGGKYQAVCNLYMLDKLNFAPVMETESADGMAVGCAAYAGVPVAGRLYATDPEADSVHFEIASYPQKGTVTLTGNEYRYTPFDGCEGSDSFTVIAIDRYGNRSAPVSVPCTVMKRENNLSYADMQGHDAYTAALTMSYCGAMSGSVIGGEAIFSPDEAVTRAEFVAALVTALGIDADDGISAVFSDSESVPSHLMPAVAAAIEMGWIGCGKADSFRPNDPMTRAEAAEILCACLQCELFPVPGTDHTTRALLAMADMGILPLTDGAIAPQNPLTRGDAAMAICAVLDRM